MIDRQILILVGAVSVMFVAVMIILSTSISRADRNFEVISLAIQEIRQLQENVTATSDIRGEKFIRYLEAESEDVDEELDDLRNLTLASIDHHNITVSDSAREDHIQFENGTITFSNGTSIGLGDIFGTR